MTLENLPLNGIIYLQRNQNKIRKKRIDIHDENKQFEKEKNDLPSS